ncbi:hypothetical protein Tco_0939415 [Tanacetum coccineum]|uniref:Uncharacterized protein n=1 Tax=Tanacetum coccineum TaxID=301880 RepID=A0ABQ5DKK0_9ASTR
MLSLKIQPSMFHSSQFWQTASASTSENKEMEITATINGRVKTVTEASIRRHLKLEDSDGISTLPNTKIFEQLAFMRQETKVPQLSSLPHTHVADEAVSTGVDVRYGGAATTITSLDARQDNEYKCAALETDLRQAKKFYGDAFTRLIKKVNKLEKTVKTSQARRRSRVVISDDEEDTAEEPVSTIGASMPVSTVGIVQEASTPLSVAIKDKGKAIMDEEVALKLQEEFDAAERQRITRVHYKKLDSSILKNRKIY